MDVDEALVLADRCERAGETADQWDEMAVALAGEVRRLSGLYEDAVRTLARVIAEREALDVELAKWRRA